MILFFPLQLYAEVEAFQIDNAHSFAKWQVRHVVGKVSGVFSNITGKVNINRQQLEKSQISATINVFSLDSYHQKRDAHILSKKILDATQFKFMIFESTQVVANEDKMSGIMTGQLTLHGMTKEISFPFKILGFALDPWQHYRVGLQAQLILKRSDFGIQGNTPYTNQVGNEIEVALFLEAIKLSINGGFWQLPKTTKIDVNPSLTNE